MIQRAFGRFFSAFGALAVLFLGLASAASPEKSRNHFDSDAPMREPAFFDFAILGSPGEAQWKVVTEFNPPSAPNGVSQVLAERPADSTAAALRRNVSIKDGVLSLGIKRTVGRGGLVFRMADSKNYLALLLDPVSGEARLVQCRNGRTSELASGRAEGSREWGVLGVALSGPKVTATWEGKALLEGSDAAPAAGRAGIATAGPGIMTFDELLIDPVEPAPRAR
jgi:hypothetical protein